MMLKLRRSSLFSLGVTIGVICLGSTNRLQAQDPVGLPATPATFPVCYMQLENGEIVNLETLCQRPAEDTDSASANVSSANSFDKPASSRGQCYFVDENGRPC